ncbi:MAG TPA: OadG family protein [Candidatus Limiplasma sp.]|nr:OadG family protein [Candidatus Limiplasma sp.]
MLYSWISAATDVAAESSLQNMSLVSKGLFTTLLGLVGVFLVLTLFYFSIKLMQRPVHKPSNTKE